MTTVHAKRQRSPSLVQSLPPEPVPKAYRVPLESPSSSPPQDRTIAYSPLLCTLPPTCNRHATSLANSKEMEAHYAMYHANVCEQQGCGSVFPDARLLELHQTECHDPLAALRKDRGEKIFACFLATCPRYFSTPKTRRMHLIEAHSYPKQYFFAVTNKGVGGLLRRWGEGAGMIRKEWKYRDKDANETGVNTNTGTDRMEEDDYDSDDDYNEDEEHDDEELDEPIPAPSKARDIKPKAALDPADALADEINSLSLIPSSIRFGRGARRGTFYSNESHIQNSRGRGSFAANKLDGSIVPPATVSSLPTRGMTQAPPGRQSSDGMAIDSASSPPRTRNLGSGVGAMGRGRGRASVIPVPALGGRGTGTGLGRDR